MKTFFNWLLKNLSNAFGLIGILLTIYFGSIYAPTWIKETQNEKINASKRQTIQSIKELVFSDSIVSINEIQTIVVAKELDERVTIPYSFYEILTLCQLSFMEDKFLPLAKRQELIKELELLKNKLPEQGDTKIQKAKSENNGVLLIEILSVFISLLAALAGIISFYKKDKSDKEKQEEINNEIDLSVVDISFTKFVLQKEKEYLETFLQLKEKFTDIELRIPDIDEGYDLYLKRNNKSYYIEFRFLTKSRVGLGYFRQFLNIVKERPGEAWFIYNTDLTPMVVREANNFNDNNKQTVVRLLKVTNKEELSDKVKELLMITPK